MKESTSKILDILVERYPLLISCKEDIKKAYLLLEETYKNGKKVLICGNGGSAADSEHIVGELMKGFKKKRPINPTIYNELSNFGDEGLKLQKALDGTLRAIALTSHLSLSTAFSNDKEPKGAFAQQLYG